MSRLMLVLLFVVVCGFKISGQTRELVLSGHITSASTGKPVEDVNVFLSGTIFGASTDKDGYYRISHVPEGTYEIVVSMIGFDVQITPVILKGTTEIIYDVKINPLTYQLPPVTIVAERPKKWLRDLDVFKSLLLGKTEFAEVCIIQNPEVLEFHWADKNRMTAQAGQPLKIKNHALGFEIDFVLVDFTWNKKSENTVYIFKSRFTLMEPVDDKQSFIWNQNRRAAYRGSLPHFLLSLKNRELAENGFQVIMEKEIDRRYPFRSLCFLSDAEIFLLSPAEKPGYDTLKFEDYLKVVYHKAKMSIGYLRRGGRDTKKIPQISWLRMKKPFLMLDIFGEPDSPVTFQMYGYWSRLGVADMLPRYFVP